MKIGIVGTTGYIGNKLKEVMISKEIEVLEINRKNNTGNKLDLKNPGDFDYSLLEMCDYVIFTAAISSPDYCEVNYKEAEEINVIGTSYFIREAIKREIKVIFLSSDAVYGKDYGRSFTEDSETLANTSYGKMKKKIEDLFSDSIFFKSVRLSYVVSEEDKFIKYINSCIDNGEEASIYHPFYRNCITLDEVIESIIWLIKNWNIFESVFLNICGKELISRVNIIDELNRIKDKEIRYEVVKPSDDFFKNRMKITEMKSLYLDKILKTLDEPFSFRLQRQLLK